METNDLISINSILRPLTVSLGDPEYSMGFTKGWYEDQVDECLDLLKFTLKFTGPNEPPMDIELDPLVLQFAKPKGVYDIKQVFAWDGEDLSTSVRVWWKNNFNNSPKGTSYTANISDNNSGNSNVFARSFAPPASLGSNVLWWNIQNGIMMFSAGCASYKYIRIIYSGIQGELGEIECVPRIFTRVIKDFVKWRFAEAMMYRDKSFATIADRAKNDLYDTKTGSWNEAEDFVKSMHTAQREDQKEYHSRMNF